MSCPVQTNIEQKATRCESPGSSFSTRHGKLKIVWTTVGRRRSRGPITQKRLSAPGQVTVKFADGRREPKSVVGDVQVGIQGRSSVFTAVVEPGRADALIGAIVLEELDFVPDCTRQTLLPRDPLGLIAEID